MFKEWLGEEIGWQETPRMLENRIELNLESAKNAFVKFEIIEI